MVGSGMTLVISPLIALMEDQRQQLKRRGIAAACIHSGMAYRDIDRILDLCTVDRVKILYVSPERVDSVNFQSRLAHMPIEFVAVDEAHCISQWGLDFRPSYQRLRLIKKLLPGSPIIAVTASATPAVEADIAKSLELSDPKVFRASTIRANLAYSLTHTENKEATILSRVQDLIGSSIVYTQSRSACESLARFLIGHGIKAMHYHAGLDHQERSRIQQDFIEHRVSVVICTSAFGMGIDKSDVRKVLHWEVPMSVEEYYQEAGRAGRDGKPAECEILLKSTDIHQLIQRFESQFAPVPQIKSIWASLIQYGRQRGMDAYGQISDFDYVAFAKMMGHSARLAYFSIKHLERYGWLRLDPDGLKTSELRMLCHKEHLYEYTSSKPILGDMLTTLLRTYEGLFSRKAKIDEEQLADRIGLTVAETIDQLRQLHKDGIIRYTSHTSRSSVTLLRGDDIRLDDLQDYQQLRDKKYEQFKALLRYLQAHECRSAYIAKYFGELDAPACGKCDRCLEDKGGDLYTEVYAQIDPVAGVNLMQLLSSVESGGREAIIAALDRLINDGKVTIRGDHVNRTS